MSTAIIHHDSGIELEPPNMIGTHHIYQQPPMVFPQIPQVMKSCPLMGFGVTLFILSLISLGLGSWATSLSVRPYYAYASLGCSIFFLLTGIMSMSGSRDVGARKCTISCALTFGILGVIVGIGGIISSIAALLWIKDCKVCKSELSLTNISFSCSEECIEAYFPLYIGLALLTFLEALLGLILSCCACCNVCACCCCYKEPVNGFVIRQAPVTTFIHTHTTSTAPPPYKRLNEVNNPEMYEQQAPYNVNC